MRWTILVKLPVALSGGSSIRSASRHRTGIRPHRAYRPRNRPPRRRSASFPRNDGRGGKCRARR
jgi:hypothetical protein